MPTRQILNSHTVTALKKEISKTNIKGYSKLKKTQVIDLMLQHKARFHHMKMAAAAAAAVPVNITIIKKKKTAAPPPKKAEPKDKKIKVAEMVKEIMDDLMEEIDEQAYDWAASFAKPPTKTQFKRHLDGVISYTKKNIREAIKETPMENNFNKKYPKKNWYNFYQ